MKKKLLNLIGAVCMFTLCTTHSYAATGGPGMESSAMETTMEMIRKNPETMTATEIINELYYNMDSEELVKCAKDNAALLTGEKTVVDDNGYMLIGTYNDATVMNDVAYPLGTDLQAIGVRSDGKYDALLAYTDYPNEVKKAENKKALDCLYNTAWDLKEMTETMTDKETIVYLTDWIHNNLTYQGGLEGQPATRLMNKTADCDGYAAIFHVFATFCGIKTEAVSGTWRGGAHGWNRVFLDNTWLYVDAIANRALFTTEEAAESQYVEVPFLFQTIEDAKNSGYVIP